MVQRQEQPQVAGHPGGQPAAAAVLPDEEAQAARSVARARVRNIVNSLSVAGGLIILAIIFSVASPYFLTALNIYHIFQQVAVVAVLAVGQSFVIFTAGIDLSQASVVALCGAVGATVMVSDHSVLFGLLVALAIGTGAGAANGLLITRVKLVPFIATLAMLGVASGAALLFTGGQPVFNIPAEFTAFGSNGIYVFPYIVMVAAGIAVVFQFYSTQTRGGRYVYAIGSNQRAAAIAGIPSNRVLVGVYTLSGVLAGVAAILQVAYVDSAQPVADTNVLLESIAAVVIGGGSLFGGEGTIWGSMIGALLIAVLYNGTELLGISSYIQTILLGVVVVIAVGIDNLRRRERVAA
jgi:ribose transport system permease protein